MSDRLTPETTAARSLSLCGYLPRYIVGVEVAEKLECERDEAREEIAGWKNKWRVAVEMAATAEAELGILRSNKLSDPLLETTLKHLIRERDEALEQRDRLAEALRECREDSVELLGERDWWKNEPRLDCQKRYRVTRDNIDRADKALQSLEPEP